MSFAEDVPKPQCVSQRMFLKPMGFRRGCSKNPWVSQMMFQKPIGFAEDVSITHGFRRGCSKNPWVLQGFSEDVEKPTGFAEDVPKSHGFRRGCSENPWVSQRMIQKPMGFAEDVSITHGYCRGCSKFPWVSQRMFQKPMGFAEDVPKTQCVSQRMFPKPMRFAEDVPNTHGVRRGYIYIYIKHGFRKRTSKQKNTQRSFGKLPVIQRNINVFFHAAGFELSMWTPCWPRVLPRPPGDTKSGPVQKLRSSQAASCRCTGGASAAAATEHATWDLVESDMVAVTTQLPASHES